ncbi:hypothetical protein FHS19_007013 [Paenibacillus rhizosphaerae]|uniref:Uncharacterized protein n=1 Tax=Paenibacillus rhizosphaerae TaxID=297318 RepID=A0A839TYE0_9BACL|nr:hypothetical protein [Paenibacillus rhizosphaerae]MBB3132284.1 hypothetical protein [Paenibacillus rhizosphaerae]
MAGCSLIIMLSFPTVIAIVEFHITKKGGWTLTPAAVSDFIELIEFEIAPNIHHPAQQRK